MSEDLHQEPVDQVEEAESEKTSPIINSVHKLREVSQTVTKLGEDLNQLVLMLEELTTMIKLFSGLGKKPAGQQGSPLPLTLLTSLLSKSGAESGTGALDINQLLLALLSSQMGQNK